MFISQEIFFEENKNSSFDSWKNWHIILRPNAAYYIAYYDTCALYYYNNNEIKNSIYDRRIKRFIIFKKDTTPYIRLTPGDTLSKALLLNNFVYDSIWIKYYTQINPDEIVKNCNFILKYNFELEEIIYMKEPERLHFKSDSIDLMYLYKHSESGCCGYTNKLTTHWFSR
jgi:hypothetical protein